MKPFFFTTFILFSLSASFSSAAVFDAKTCRSDVKGFCAYSAPKEGVTSGKQNKSREFAAESESFVVPGIEFLQIQGNASLGDILIRMYTWLLGLVGISAVLMFIWGGIQYATATEGGVKEAKKKIGNAAFGLVIALLAYLGLITINPDFVKTLDLKLRPIDEKIGVPIEGAACSTAGNCRGTYEKGPDGKTLICKTDPSCVVNNPNVCTIAVECPDKTRPPPEQKIFRTAEQCKNGCAPPREPCPGFETYEIIKIGCGIENLIKPK